MDISPDMLKTLVSISERFPRISVNRIDKLGVPLLITRSDDFHRVSTFGWQVSFRRPYYLDHTQITNVEFKGDDEQFTRELFILKMATDTGS